MSIELNDGYKIYTDGGCRPTNPGKGGFGVAIFNNRDEIVDLYSEESAWTTNNIMELRALGYAVEYCLNHEEARPATIYTDSAYAMNCILSWCDSWIRNGWLTSKGDPVQNKELIQSIYNNYNTNFMNTQVKIQKVKGHVGIVGNEIVDRLAAADFSEVHKIISQNHIVVNCNLDKMDEMANSSQT